MTDPTPAPTPDAQPEPDKGTPTPDAEALTAEAEKWKALARKHEERAQSNASAAKELEALRRSQMSETEKAVDAAKAEARTAALRELGGKLVDAELRAAAAGRTVDVDALLEVVDRSRFLTDDGDVDRKALGAWVDRIAPAPADTGPVIPSFDGGVRTTHAPGTAADQFAKALGPLLNH
jgi:hypothetical protein